MRRLPGPKALGGALLGATLLAGCATTPMPPPALAFAGQNCAAAPDLAQAQAMVPQKRKKLHTVSSPVEPSTRCLVSGGTATPYVLYAIPAGDVRMIEVGAQLEGRRIFSPKVAILDAAGTERRTFAPEDFLFRTGLYSVQFVPQPGDRYILVTADPARVGKDYSSVFIGTSTTAVYTGFGTASWTSGVDEQSSRTFSYDGAVVANVHLPGNEG